MRPLSPRILCTGITSIHGWPVFSRLRTLFGTKQVFGIRPPNVRIPEGDAVASVCVTNAVRLAEIATAFKPTHIVHMAGVCDLDMCEEDPDRAYMLNVLGTKTIVDVFSEKCRIVYTSADLVFSGNTPPQGGYTEQHAPDPVSVAGKTYVAAEREMTRASNGCILRLGLPMGASLTGEAGAIDFIESRFKRNLPMTLFYDEWRSCIHCDDIAEVAGALLGRTECGLYHCGGPAGSSLYDIGAWIIERGGYNPRHCKRIARSEEKNGPPRMGDVRLNSKKIELLLGITFRPWPDQMPCTNTLCLDKKAASTYIVNN